MKVTRAAVALLSLSTSVAAWPFELPRWLSELHSLVPRADNGTSSSSSSASLSTPTATPASNSGSESVTQTNLNTAGLSATLPPTATGGTASNLTTTKATATSHTTYNAQDPAGSITMISPATTAAATELYRIGEFVTWQWNYTGLSATPTALDIMVSCSAATETWTLTKNMSFQSVGSYTWDTGSYQQTAIASPLLVDMYTLVIVDAESSISATAEAGYLAAYTGFQFGLYTGRPYTPLSEWVCATCSGAMSDMERRVVGVAVITSIVTVLSFTWFVAGFGAFI